MTLISQVKAAALAEVSKQRINQIKKDQEYSFFVGSKIDTDHPDWHMYLNNRKNDVKLKVEKTETAQSKPAKRTKAEQKKSVSKKLITDVSDSEDEERGDRHELTAGYNPDDIIFRPTTPQQLKALTEVVRTQMDMQIRLGDLVQREIVITAISQIAHVIQSHLVDLPRKQSAKITKKLKRVGMEKEVEKILAEPIAKAIQEVKRTCDKVVRKKYIKNETN